MLSPHPFLEPEGTGADGRSVHGMRLRVPAVAEDVLGNDRHQERDQRLHESGMRLVEPDRDGMGVRRVHPVHRVEHGDAERVVFLHDREREGDILGGHRPAVVEAGVRVEMEGVAAAVFGNLPAFGEIGPGFEVAADAHQPGEELDAEAGLGAGLHGGIEVAQAGAAGDDERAAPYGFRRGGGNGGCADSEREDRGNGRAMRGTGEPSGGTHRSIAGAPQRSPGSACCHPYLQGED